MIIYTNGKIMCPHAPSRMFTAIEIKDFNDWICYNCWDLITNKVIKDYYCRNSKDDDL